MRVDNHILILDPYITQMSPNGRGFKVVGVKKDLSYDSQWIDGMEKFRWIVTVKFVDDSQRVKFHFDHTDQCVKKEKCQKKILENDELLVLQEQNPRPSKGIKPAKAYNKDELPLSGAPEPSSR